MPKRNFASDKLADHKPQTTDHRCQPKDFIVVCSPRSVVLSIAGLLCVALCGCATAQYSIRQTPTPDESASAIQLERTISAYQAKDFDTQQARLVGQYEKPYGFAIQEILNKLSRVTERSYLYYRAFVYEDKEPNAAALADGRVYVSTGMLAYLQSRPNKEDELAFVLSHELAHTVAQHLLKRYRLMQQQQLLMALVAAGASAATRNAAATAQQAGHLAMDIASLLQDVANSGYSQQNELEADQLGIRYVIRAGFNPRGALYLLQDFTRFDNPWPFLRTHPYITQRQEDLRRYLEEIGQLKSAPDLAVKSQSNTGEEIRRLREAQRLYPEGSISWKNLQKQIDGLK